MSGMLMYSHSRQVKARAARGASQILLKLLTVALTSAFWSFVLVVQQDAA